MAPHDVARRDLASRGLPQVVDRASQVAAARVELLLELLASGVEGAAHRELSASRRARPASAAARPPCATAMAPSANSLEVRAAISW